jgi:hypothetical protein
MSKVVRVCAAAGPAAITRAAKAAAVWKWVVRMGSLPE